MISIIPAVSKQDCVEIQTVFNDPGIIQYLGGFCILDSLLSKVNQSGTTIWKAVYDDKTVGGYLTAGRSQCHQMKLGEVGVLPAYRRRRIGTALYAAGIFQSVLEGRRIVEDTIVGDNPFQFKALAALEIPQVGTFPMKTASFKDIALFCLNITSAKIEHILGRLSYDTKITLRHDYYTDDLWKKNVEIYNKQNPSFIEDITKCRKLIFESSRVYIQQGPVKPPHDKGKKKQIGKDETFI